MKQRVWQAMKTNAIVTTTAEDVDVHGAKSTRVKRELFVVREVLFTHEWAGYGENDPRRIEHRSMGNACVILVAFNDEPPTLRGGCGGQIVPWSEGIDREEVAHVHEMMEHAWRAWEVRFGAPPYKA